LIRGIVLWTIWLEMNHLCFNDNYEPKTVAMIGMQIISFHKRYSQFVTLIKCFTTEHGGSFSAGSGYEMSEGEIIEKILVRDLEDTPVILAAPMFESVIDE
jgi:hypothetical protein